ncbi:MAG TPA: rhodanese-like domain-containing protein, partial [Thermoanaerobaculia bacterium]|nr:rhodanese-like domain-containing protein [Thermoanaerobaculia bacterium]
MSASGTEIAVAALLAKIDAGERILLLDVRNDEEFERWRVEGREPVATMHRPYFDFIEDETLLGEVPRDAGEVFVICAKGDSSDLIAQMLRDRGVAARNVAGGMVAYGESLLPARLPLDPDEAESFEIWQMNRRGKGCLSYVIRSGPEAVVVDPSRNLAEYERFVASRDAKIIAVFDTHVHADHVSGGPR